MTYGAKIETRGERAAREAAAWENSPGRWLSRKLGMDVIDMTGWRPLPYDEPPHDGKRNPKPVPVLVTPERSAAIPPGELDTPRPVPGLRIGDRLVLLAQVPPGGVSLRDFVAERLREAEIPHDMPYPRHIARLLRGMMSEAPAADVAPPSSVHCGTPGACAPIPIEPPRGRLR